MGEDSTYRVLARKYRPMRFSDLIGQEALVRTLTNAIGTGRLAHAYLLTGVRGIGKTSAARILARALNCTGNNKVDADVIVSEPCNKCENCAAIFEDRHVDVLEMDAASHTGVDDMRELIDGIRYRPSTGRYRIYIIDEVHMLSRQAFNALLKTLEEPPAHAKFIFATTEVRRLPVTVLSRCQRFDLRRVSSEILITHFKDIAERETANIEEGAISLIARASDGSVRDGLSLLDQAIAHGKGTVFEIDVRKMLGIADRSQILELFTAIMEGKASQGIRLLEEQYQSGVDPLVVLEDLLELTHWLTRIKLVPEISKDASTPEIEGQLGANLSSKLAMPELSRTWQMLLKGLSEARIASDALMAAEMILIRIAYAADLPTPADILKNLDHSSNDLQKPPPAPKRNLGAAQTPEKEIFPEKIEAKNDPDLSKIEPSIDISDHVPTNLGDIVNLAEKNREMELRHWLVSDIHLVSFSLGHIKIREKDRALKPLASELEERLKSWTGRAWKVTLSKDTGNPTLEEQANEKYAKTLKAAEKEPLIRQVIENFPESEIVGLKNNTTPE